MKIKTSVTLSPELIAAIDRVSGPQGRSAFIERSVETALREMERIGRDRRDAEIYAHLEAAGPIEGDDDIAVGFEALGDDFAEDDFVTPAR